MEKVIERVIDMNELTNGKLIKARVPAALSDSGEVVLSDAFLWIRGFKHEEDEDESAREKILRTLIVETHPMLKKMEVPVMAVLEGRYQGMEFQGISTARKEGIIDPRDASWVLT